MLGVVFGFFINYGVTKSCAGTDKQWMLPTLLQLVPAVIWGVGTFICPESPRWLFATGRRERAIATLCHIRKLPTDHPLAVSEINAIEIQILHEVEAVSNSSLWDQIQETLIPIDNRRRFFLIFMATLFSEWSDANAITQYSPTIFGDLGIKGRVNRPCNRHIRHREVRQHNAIRYLRGRLYRPSSLAHDRYLSPNNHSRVCKRISRCYKGHDSRQYQQYTKCLTRFNRCDCGHLSSRCCMEYRLVQYSIHPGTSDLSYSDSIAECLDFDGVSVVILLCFLAGKA